MNLKYQKQLIDGIIENKETINKKEKWIKILDSNFITRFFFKHTINILELEIMQIHLNSIGNGIKGIIDIKRNKSKENKNKQEVKK